MGTYNRFALKLVFGLHYRPRDGSDAANLASGFISWDTGHNVF